MEWETIFSHVILESWPISFHSTRLSLSFFFYVVSGEWQADSAARHRQTDGDEGMGEENYYTGQILDNKDNVTAFFDNEKKDETNANNEAKQQNTGDFHLISVG